MRFILLLVIISFAAISCQETCNESDCKGSAALFSFRVLDENQLDLVFDSTVVDSLVIDSVKVFGSNDGAISTLEKQLSIKSFDTIPVFQFNVDNVHLRYLVRTYSSGTTITDTLRTEYILQNSDCCGIELLSYQSTLNGTLLCNDCQPSQINTILR